MSRSKSWHNSWKKKAMAELWRTHGYLDKKEYRRRMKLMYLKELNLRQDQALDLICVLEFQKHPKYYL